MFPSRDSWELALWIVATYLAVWSLLRLMAWGRKRLLAKARQAQRDRRRRQAQLILARKRRAAMARPHVVDRDPAR